MDDARNYTVLIIDDDEAICSMLKVILQDAGFAAEEVREAKIALKHLKQGGVDLIVTDIVMPDMDGIETIMQIRKIDKDIPIIAMSGGGRIGPDDYLTLAEKLGADKVFTKPFNHKELIAAISELLS